MPGCANRSAGLGRGGRAAVFVEGVGGVLEGYGRVEVEMRSFC